MSAVPHVPVLAREVVEYLALKPEGVYVDCTLGYGGHAEAILEAVPGARCIGLDRDPAAVAFSRVRLAKFGERVRVHHRAFSQLAEVLRQENAVEADGVLADLGVSSLQLDDVGRGFSFRNEGPLDMRMDTERGMTAAQWLAGQTETALGEVLRTYGEVAAPFKVARAILAARDAGRLGTTGELRAAVESVVRPPRKGMGIHPATLVFQAIRIAVNDELGELESLLAALPWPLKAGGRVAVISFHSLEDRMVKHRFRELEGRAPRDPYSTEAVAAPVLRVLTRRPAEAGDDELATNPRARSAKLRVAERIA